MKEIRIPQIHPTAYIAPGAVVRGDVTMMEGANIWHNSVVHGDPCSITIGRNSSIQELTMVHVGFDNPCSIGDNVNIGHNCIIHGCIIEDCVTIGMGAIIMDGARIGTGSFVGAGAVVTENTNIPPNSVVVGMPARVIKMTTEAQRQNTLDSVEFYLEEVRHMRGD